MLAFVPLGFTTYMGFQWNTYVAGETRGVNKTIPRALLASVIITMISLAILVTATYSALGEQFVGGMSYLYNSGQLSSMPVEPTVNLLISFALPAWVGILINLGMAIGFFLCGLVSFAVMPRVFFAMSFERVLPAKISAISDRFHTPFVACIVFSIPCLIYLAIVWFWGYFGTFLNSSLAAPLAYILPGLAAFLLPVMKKDLYKSHFKNLPGWLGSRIGPVPAISLAGLALAVTFLYDVYSLLVPISSYTYLGSSIPFAVGFLGACIIVGLAIFEVSRWYHKREGIDISVAFKQIPPE
jgi:amino acid transporter